MAWYIAWHGILPTNSLNLPGCQRDRCFGHPHVPDEDRRSGRQEGRATNDVDAGPLDRSGTEEVRQVLRLPSFGESICGEGLEGFG